MINLTKAACPIYDFTLVSGQLKRDYTECYEWRTKAMERISAEQPAMIVTSAAIFSERDGDFAEHWADGVSTTIGELRQTGAQVVELDDTPFPRQDIPKCLAKNLNAAEACDLPIAGSRRATRNDGTAPPRWPRQAGATHGRSVPLVLRTEGLPGDRRQHPGLPGQQPHHGHLRGAARAAAGSGNYPPAEHDLAPI